MRPTQRAPHSSAPPPASGALPPPPTYGDWQAAHEGHQDLALTVATAWGVRGPGERGGWKGDGRQGENEGQHTLCWDGVCV